MPYAPKGATGVETKKKKKLYRVPCTIPVKIQINIHELR
jgi:hypothetical protein